MPIPAGRGEADKRNVTKRTGMGADGTLSRRSRESGNLVALLQPPRGAGFPLSRERRGESERPPKAPSQNALGDAMAHAYGARRIVRRTLPYRYGIWRRPRPRMREPVADQSHARVRNRLHAETAIRRRHFRPPMERWRPRRSALRSAKTSGRP